MSRAGSSAARTVIVGAGLTGLAIAGRLARAGVAVTVIERRGEKELASTAADSVAEHGWLHSGGLFARRDPHHARHCYETLQATRQYCPECLSPGAEGMAYLFSEEETPVRAWTNAWERAGILHAEMAAAELRETMAGLRADPFQQAFLLPDCGFRIDILERRLANAAEADGAEFLRGRSAVDIVFQQDRVEAILLDHGERIRASRLILAGDGPNRLLLENSAGAFAAGRGLSPVTLAAPRAWVAPELHRQAFCVLDANGLHHVPHAGGSLVGIDVWITVPLAEAPLPPVIGGQSLWRQMSAIFPKWDRSRHQIREIPLSADEFVSRTAGVAGPIPAIVHHSAEFPAVRNLTQVLPGWSTPWAAIADAVCESLSPELCIGTSGSAAAPWALRRSG